MRSSFRYIGVKRLLENKKVCCICEFLFVNVADPLILMETIYCKPDIRVRNR